MNTYTISDAVSEWFYDGSGGISCALTDKNQHKINLSIHQVKHNDLINGKKISGYPIISLGHVKIYHPSEPVGVYSRKAVGILKKYNNSMRVDIGGVQWKLLDTEKSHDLSQPIKEAGQKLLLDLGFIEGDKIGFDETGVPMTTVFGSKPYFPVTLFEITQETDDVFQSKIPWVE